MLLPLTSLSMAARYARHPIVAPVPRMRPMSLRPLVREVEQEANPCPKSPFPVLPKMVCPCQGSDGGNGAPEGSGTVMIDLRRRTRVAIGAALAAVAIFGSTPALSASAEPAGQYVYECVSIYGDSYTLPHGARLSTCHGANLKVYISGRFVRSVELKVPKYLNRKPTQVSGWCVVAIVGTGASAAGMLATGGLSTIAWVGLASDSIGGIAACTA